MRKYFIFILILFFSCSVFSFTAPNLNILQPFKTPLEINQAVKVPVELQLKKEISPGVREYYAFCQPVNGREAHIRNFLYGHSVDGMNLYCFVNGNVVNLVDPMGLYSWKEFGEDAWGATKTAGIVGVNVGSWLINPFLGAVVTGSTLGYGTASSYHGRQAEHKAYYGREMKKDKAAIMVMSDLTGMSTVFETMIGYSMVSPREITTREKVNQWTNMGVGLAVGYGTAKIGSKYTPKLKERIQARYSRHKLKQQKMTDSSLAEIGNAWMQDDLPTYKTFQEFRKDFNSEVVTRKYARNLWDQYNKSKTNGNIKQFFSKNKVHKTLDIDLIDIKKLSTKEKLLYYYIKTSTNKSKFGKTWQAVADPLLDVALPPGSPSLSLGYSSKSAKRGKLIWEAIKAGKELIKY